MTTVKSIGDSWRDSGQPERQRPGAWWTSTPSCIFPRNASTKHDRTHPQGIPRWTSRYRPLISIKGLQERFATVGKNAKICVALKYTRPRWNVWMREVICYAQVYALVRQRRCTARIHTTVLTQSLHAIDRTTPSRVNYQQIKWPSAKCNNEWIQFDEDVSKIIQTRSNGNADRRLNVLSAIIVSYAKERFGLHEGKQEKIYGKNRRAKKVQDLRHELRALKEKYKQASEGECQPLTELRKILRAKLRTIRKAEWHRRCRKERARKRTSFLTDPFGFAKKLLSDKRSGQLNCPTEELNTYLRDNLSDPERDKELGNLEAVIRPHQPTTKFDLEEPSWKEVREVVKAARSASVPGPSRVPYSIYKCCPGLLLLL